MIQGCATLVVDLGNSSTRGRVQFGKDPKTGKVIKRKFDIPNSFAPLPKDYEVSADYTDDNSAILSVDTVLRSTTGDIPVKGNYCCGLLQERERPTAAMRPTAKASKFDNATTVLSFRYAFLQAFKEILLMRKCHDFSQLDITWKVVTLLPPGDIKFGASKIVEIISEIKEIDFVLPNVKLPVNISANDIYVLPEGFVAYAGTIYDEGQVYRPETQFLTEEVVLVEDIGAGTTDILVIDNNSLVQESKFTITIGGNNVEALVRKALRLKGLDLSNEAIKKGVISGYVKDGAKKVSIVDEINTARDEIATQINSEFIHFLEESDIKIREVGYLLVCGGGASPSLGEGTVPISEAVLRNVKTFAPNAELVVIPNQLAIKEDEEGNTVKVEEPISPRDLNIVGASIIAEVY